MIRSSSFDDCLWVSGRERAPTLHLEQAGHGESGRERCNQRAPVVADERHSYERRIVRLVTGWEVTVGWRERRKQETGESYYTLSRPSHCSCSCVALSAPLMQRIAAANWTSMKDSVEQVFFSLKAGLVFLQTPKASPDQKEQSLPPRFTVESSLPVRDAMLDAKVNCAKVRRAYKLLYKFLERTWR